MRQFKTGDVVTVIKGLKERDICKYGYVEEMSEFEGRLVTLEEMCDNEYCLLEDSRRFCWNVECFEEFYIDEEDTNTIYFAKTNSSVIIPNKREEDAGYDIYANFDEDYVIIEPHQTKMIPTKLITSFSDKYVMILKERGSTGSKGIGQRCGIIDSGFRGEIFVPLTNTTSNRIIIWKEGMSLPSDGIGGTIYPYEKAICQAIMVKVPRLKTKEISPEEIREIKSERGESCLGQSGK